MPDVWVGRINRGLEKLFNIKGGPTVVDVNHQVQAEYAIPVGLEERYLFGVESFAGGSAQAGVAANKTAAMIRNPIGSNVIVVVEKIAIAPAAAENIVLAVAGSNPADLATPVTNNNRADPRGRSVGTAVLSMGAPAVDPITGFLQEGIFSVGTTNTDLILYENQEIVLLPQIALRIIGNLANTTLVWTIFWRERPLESSELT